MPCDALERGIEAWTEGSVGIPPYNVPQPDLFVTGSLPDSGLVKLETILLVVEIAVTSLQHDLGRKQKLYARSHLPEYWVVDVKGRCLHQFWAPIDNAHSETRVVALGEPVTAATVAHLTVPTTGL